MTPPSTRRSPQTLILSVIAAAGLLAGGLGIAAAAGAFTGYQPGPLADSTACGVLTADQAAGDTGDIDRYLRAADPYAAILGVEVQIEADRLPRLLGECQDHPDEVLSAAYDKAVAAADGDTAAPTTDVALPSGPVPSTLTIESTCGDYLRAGASGTVNAATVFLAAHPSASGLAVTNFCTNDPGATLADALEAQGVQP